MCICINCQYVDRCVTYHAVEEQHQQLHLTETPSSKVIVREAVKNDFYVMGCKWKVF
jgi:hypothetical protein